MKHIASSFVAITGVLAIYFSSSAIAADKYEIHLDRLMAVGQIYEITGVYQSAESDRDQMGHPTNVNDGIRLEATEKVVEVNSFGFETKATLTIHQFIRVKNGNLSTLARNGEILTIKRNGSDETHVDGGQGIDDDVSHYMAEVMQMGSPQGNAADDAAFGTPDPQYPNQSWPVNRKLAIQMLIKDDPSITENDVQGATKFAHLSYDRGTEYLTFNVAVNIDKYEMPKDMPYKMKETQGGETFTETETVPDGKFGPPTNWAWGISSFYVFEGRVDSGATVRLTGTQSATATCKRTIVPVVKAGTGN